MAFIQNIEQETQLFQKIANDFLREFGLTKFRNQVDIKFLLDILREEINKDHPTLESLVKKVRERMRQYYIAQYNIIAKDPFPEDSNANALKGIKNIEHQDFLFHNTELKKDTIYQQGPDGSQHTIKLNANGNSMLTQNPETGLVLPPKTFKEMNFGQPLTQINYKHKIHIDSTWRNVRNDPKQNHYTFYLNPGGDSSKYGMVGGIPPSVLTSVAKFKCISGVLPNVIYLTTTAGGTYNEPYLYLSVNDFKGHISSSCPSQTNVFGILGYKEEWYNIPTVNLKIEPDGASVNFEDIGGITQKLRKIEISLFNTSGDLFDFPQDVFTITNLDNILPVGTYRIITSEPNGFVMGDPFYIRETNNKALDMSQKGFRVNGIISPTEFTFLANNVGTISLTSGFVILAKYQNSFLFEVTYKK